MSETVPKRKLIEVALPLEAINRESAREKSIRHGHPSTVHLWWSRKPLATARAILFAQLVDDPSSHPEAFPTEADQQTERERLHRIIERLVVWKNSWDKDLLLEAHNEILRSTGDNPPAILDPFAGGGTIPLEAQRLGLEAHASDLNPVAVLINKVLIEIPPKFAGRTPVFPDLATSSITGWTGSEGLAADVRAYGGWMLDEAKRRIGHQYPKATSPDGSEKAVIAWIWARTVMCPNPACGIEMPLVGKWSLSKKKGKVAFVIPNVVRDGTHPSGRRVEFSIGPSEAHDPAPTMSGRRGAVCVSCGASVAASHIKSEGLRGNIGSALLATVAQGDRRRLYLPPTEDQVLASQLERPDGAPSSELSKHPQYMGAPQWGLTKHADLYTNRQLVALQTFTELVGEARQKVLDDANTPGESRGERLAEGGLGDEAYADAIATCLGLAVSRLADRNSSLCSWDSSTDKISHVFTRQAIPMTWDYVEAMPLSDATGGFKGQLNLVAKVIEASPQLASQGFAEQCSANDADLNEFVISTDPPYYDSVPYADLTDFFYVWLRESLGDVFPTELGTMLVPKSEELVADHSRHGSKTGAKEFFETGFREFFTKARNSASSDFPMTVYYALKATDSGSSDNASTGWETILDSILQAGWVITSTWPIRSELANRVRSQKSNALASSIVLTLRPRPDRGEVTDRRGILAALKSELPPALRALEQGHIAPVDLPQAAIGPGMAVFSRYGKVVDADGSQMSVRSALAHINEILDEVLSSQEGDFDPTTRFAIAWYRQHGYQGGIFGDANNLANARNTSVDKMAQSGIITSAAGKVRLLSPHDLPETYDPAIDDSISAWEVLQHMVRVLESDGIGSAATLLTAASERPDDPVYPELVKELSFLLFPLAEKNNWTQDALAFNNLATSWPDILAATRDQDSQSTFEFEDE